LGPKIVEFEIGKVKMKRRIRDGWKVEMHSQPSSRRKMFITPGRFKLYLKIKNLLYFRT
jgi:hypothetical protein